jgi:hypothetical protein
VASIKAIERNIGKLEGFDIRFCHHSGKDVRSDKTLIPAYPFEFAAEGSMTVTAWKEQRFMPAFPDFKAEILDASGQECDGEMLLSKVRKSYGRK